jgi:hypothetical protein
MVGVAVKFWVVVGLRVHLSGFAVPSMNSKVKAALNVPLKAALSKVACHCFLAPSGSRVRDALADEL